MKSAAVLRIHAKKRAQERFGIALTSKQIAAIVTDIQQGKVNHIAKISRNRSKFRIFLEGNPCIVVYDKRRRTIVTFLYETERKEECQQPKAT